MSRWRRRVLVVGGVVLGVLASGTLVWAAVPHSSTGRISACVAKSGADKGALRVIDVQVGEKCTKSETKIEWASRGLRFEGVRRWRRISVMMS